MPAPGTSVLYGTDGDDNLAGSTGNDIISSGLGNDTLDGGAGSDRLYGGDGDDTYIWDPVAGGRDWLGDEGGNDTIRINAVPSDLTFSTTQSGHSLRIQFGHTAHLDIAQYFDTSVTGSHIESIVFADGTVWTRQQVEAALTGPLLPAENLAPEIIWLDGGRVLEGSGTVDLVVGFVRAHDENGDALTYTLVDDAGGRFHMVGHAIRVADWSLIDYETAASHEVRVRVTDAAGASTEQTFTIEILDRQDEPAPPPPPPPPENHAPNNLWLDNSTIYENAPGGTIVGHLSAHDADGDEIRFQLLEGGDLFSIEGNMLRLRQGAVLDYETQPIHNIKVVAVDSRGGVSEVYSIAINVMDVAEEMPQPPDNHAPTNISLSGNWVVENPANGCHVGWLSAVDPDGDAIAFELVDNADGRFALNGNVVVVADASRIDYEANQYHWIKVKVTDSRGLSTIKDLSILIVDVEEGSEPPTPPPPQNHAPTMVTLDGASVQENAHNGTRIGQIRAYDPDGDALSFTLLDDAGGRFAIENGYVVVADGARLDYEGAPQHHITVLVSDGRGGTREAVFTIQVRDEPEQPPTPPNHPPADIILSSRLVGENALNGTEVGVFSVIDPDQDNAFSLELVDNAQGRFELVNGRLVVADGLRLDYETQAVHTVVLQVTDASGHILQKSFNIELIDRPDDPPPPQNRPPSDLALSRTSIQENAVSGSHFARISASDPDGDTLIYEIVGPHSGAFRLVMNDLVIDDASQLDFETSPTQTITIRAKDGRGGYVDRTFTIEVTDVDEGEIPPPENHAPVNLSLYGWLVRENAASDTLVGTLNALDPDGDGLTYSLLDNAGGRFAIDGNKLVVTRGASLDYEADRFHDVTVRVSDSHGASEERTFTISVTDMMEILTGSRGNDVIRGGSGRDKLVGGDGNDRLIGGSGDDILSGGLGRNTLTGGQGKDAFAFDARLARGQADRITDFSVKDDTIHLARSVFKTIGKKGMLSNKAFAIGAKADDALDRLIYDARKGTLYWDPDGSGGKAQIEIAMLQKGLWNMKHSDFLVI